MTHTAFDLPRLRRLHQWLTLESWAGVSCGALYWLPYSLVGSLLGIAAVAFTPILVVHLWALGRRGWLATFVGLMGGLFLLGGALPGPWRGLLGLLPLLGFYVFTWVLKLAVGEWIQEVEEAIRWRIEKARWADEAAAEMAALP